MTPDPFRNTLILTGPTGSGKSSLGIEVAERLGAEIVSMDSMAVYRGMDIGTAKPSPEQLRRVPHHLLDLLDPWESASVAWWLAQAAGCCRDIERRGKRVLLVGGTPLYLKALLRGLFDGPPADEQIRQRLLEEAKSTGPKALHARLFRVDPKAAARLHPNDLRRVIRALEVWELTGLPISDWQQEWHTVGSKQSAVGSAEEASSSGQPRPLPTALWIDLPRSELYARIDARVDYMVAAGLVEEVRRLRELPRPVSKEARQALGYKEVFGYLDGRASLQETIACIKTRSRHFAKRQVTWFRHLPECQPTNRQLTFKLWGLTMS